MDNLDFYYPQDRVFVDCPHSTGGFLFTCEHASNFLPDRYKRLLPVPEGVRSHVAWDLYALPLATMMARELSSTLIASKVSRAVIDCNRDPSAHDLIPTLTEYCFIERNMNLSRSERDFRLSEYHSAYHDTIDRWFERQKILNLPIPVLISVHTFTRVFNGERRKVDLGILYDRDSRLADAMIKVMEHQDFNVARNQPYGPGDGTLYAIVRHAEARHIPHLMLEVCYDLLDNHDKQVQWSQRLSGWLKKAKFMLEHDNNEVGRLPQMDPYRPAL